MTCRVTAMLVFRKSKITVIMAPKRKRSDVGSASNSKSSRDVLCVSGKLKIVDMIEIKNCMLS